MIRSMTGYGRGLVDSGRYKITVELRAVNSRFLDIHLRLPKELSDLEALFRRELKKEILRGRVDVNVGVEVEKAEGLVVDRELVERYLYLFHQLKQDFQLPGELNISTLAQLPGIVTVRSANLVASSPEFLRHVEAVLREALEALNAMRREEGAMLEADIRARLQRIDSWLEQIESLSVKLPDYYRTRLLQRMQELLQGSTVDEARLAQEAAFLAERSDISEEVIRLKSHIRQFHDLLEGGADAGKKLEFILQEMHREANTILSKTGTLEISQHGISMKAEVERLREQIQNVE